MPHFSFHKTPSKILQVAILALVVLLAACQAPLPPTQIAVPSATSTSTFMPTFTPEPTSTIQIPTKTPKICMETTGKVVVADIPTKLLKNPVNVRVYLPPCYDSSPKRNYPVLYMLHGMDSTNNQWERIGLFSTMDKLLKSGEAIPFIIVLPNEYNTNMNATISNYGDALVQEVIPYIEEEFRVCQQRECRAIGGLSRGGNWAVQLAFTYPEKFIAMGAHSTPLFYGETTEIINSITQTAASEDLPSVYIDVGNKDEDKKEVYTFVSTLKKLKVPYVFTEYLGYHDEVYWSEHVADYLKWYSSKFAQNQP